MTDRLNGCWVAFDHDIREDDADQLLNAIRMIKGVLAVEANNAQPSDWIAQQRVRREIGDALLRVLYPENKS